jgi:mRNA interferase RelE/StbE
MPVVLIKPPAEKDLRDLSPELRSRLIVAINALRESPFPPGAEKLRGLAAHFRLRVSDYRILYTFETAPPTITIYRVKHRREAYR